MYYAYILYSPKINQFYAGQTDDLNKRLTQHNQGRNKSTKNGIPWILVTFFPFNSRSEAVLLEKKIKARGIKRFLNDNNLKIPLQL